MSKWLQPIDIFNSLTIFKYYICTAKTMNVLIMRTVFTFPVYLFSCSEVDSRNQVSYCVFTCFESM